MFKFYLPASPAAIERSSCYSQRKISSLHSIKDDLTLKAESQTEQIDKLKSKVARLSSASEDAEKKWLKTEKQWLKREQDWTEREQGYEQQIEELGAELERSRNKERKTRERVSQASLRLAGDNVGADVSRRPVHKRQGWRC